RFPVDFLRVPRLGLRFSGIDNLQRFHALQSITTPLKFQTKQ
ncbi:unnamed protein product, partial [marine sediment metagenome]